VKRLQASRKSLIEKEGRKQKVEKTPGSDAGSGIF